ncbi:aminotransferase class I/II-fold pyridoxal phosphate-dependent enzyme [Helicobacter suis]|uniref:8-amino-7-oxononanoate synthase n=1 Tax=Helicobacter suis TaxID=104628 RepID=A0A6J4CWB8_9HELI|nr:pyridoxal phosphate-dependent aminotransferase family protein [Helicobacter suis]EFX43226.1 8-amino-7-oxononanoate synthase (BioF) [Helicobacter suis HS1]BCD69686.1 8-amino-7-oxononanoate synthase [Helicobacter suis]BDR28979.1 8-amino-7-oxononanoate synthase [Helicobacter suis HS1]
MFNHALKALKRANLHRERCLYPPTLADFASNDYLALASRKDLLQEAFHILQNLPSHAPKASMLVNGYYPLHQELENYLCDLLGFESCVLVGSAFLGNLALIDALVRKNDWLLMDAHYHASGQFLAKKSPNTLFFEHNNPQDLKTKLNTCHNKGQLFIAIEGVYSMDGEIAPLEILEIAESYGAYLILDEAHSLGSIGEHLLGLLDHYQYKPTEKMILLGAFSKAYGSYGGFIAGSIEMIDFLCNRAKSILYTTSPSLLDTALSFVNLKHLYNNTKHYQEILKQMRACLDRFNWHTQSNIFTLPFVNSTALLEMQDRLIKHGFLCAAIRPPTTANPLLRLCLNIQPQRTLELLEDLCYLLKHSL